MSRENDTNRLRQLLDGDFNSFKYSEKGNWYNKPKEQDFPLRLFDSTGYIDVESLVDLERLHSYSQSKNSFHINKGGISHLEEYIPLPADSGEINDILGSQNKKDG